MCKLQHNVLRTFILNYDSVSWEHALAQGMWMGGVELGRTRKTYKLSKFKHTGYTAYCDMII